MLGDTSGNFYLQRPFPPLTVFPTVIPETQGLEFPYLVPRPSPRAKMAERKEGLNMTCILCQIYKEFLFYSD